MKLQSQEPQKPKPLPHAILHPNSFETPCNTASSRLALLGPAAGGDAERFAMALRGLGFRGLGFRVSGLGNRGSGLFCLGLYTV